jgi:hypothetical protein
MEVEMNNDETETFEVGEAQTSFSIDATCPCCDDFADYTNMLEDSLEDGKRGTKGKGRTRRFTDEQVAEMRTMFYAGKSYAAIGKKFDVSGSAVEWQIKRYGK